MCFRRSEGIWPAGNGFGMGFKSPLAHIENPQVNGLRVLPISLAVHTGTQVGCTVAT